MNSVPLSVLNTSIALPNWVLPWAINYFKITQTSDFSFSKNSHVILYGPHISIWTKSNADIVLILLFWKRGLFCFAHGQTVHFFNFSDITSILESRTLFRVVVATYPSFPCQSDIFHLSWQEFCQMLLLKLFFCDTDVHDSWILKQAETREEPNWAV